MNNLKTTFLMVLLTGILILVGGAFGGKSGMTFMLVISLGMNLFSYWFSDKIVLSMYKARQVTREQAPDFYNMVEQLAHNAGIPVPKVYVIDSDTPNAFATGRSPEHASVAATTGIIRALDHDELEAVMAHELAHVKHRDTLISTVVASIAGVITWIANIAQWAMIFGGGRGNDRDEGGGVIGMLLTIIVAPIAAMLVQMAISRSREYEADAGGAKISGKPLALADALQKIEHYARYGQLSQEATPATAHMFIINPLKGGRAMASLFSTHPSTEERVKRLVEIAQQQR